MTDLIKHFIWGYQKSFRISVEGAIARAFDHLHLSLNPRVFVVGVRTSTDHRLPPACVEPEHNHWANSEALYDVLQDVAQHRAADPESQLWHSHPVAQERESERLHRRALKNAMLARLAKMPERPVDSEVFLSFPVERPDFLVMVGLEVTASTLVLVPAIRHNVVEVHEYRKYEVSRSLAHAVIEVFLKQAAVAAMLPEAGAGGAEIDGAEHLVRRAGEDFFTGLMHRIESDYQIVDDRYSPLCDLSLLPYEGEGAAGQLGFWRKGEIDAACEIKLAEKIPLSSGKAVRKMLMLGTGGRRLVCDATSVQGILPPAANPEVPIPSVEVAIVGRGQWRVSAEGKELLHVADGSPRVPATPVDEAQTAFELRRRVPTMSEDQATQFAKVARTLTHADHGAVLVIVPDGAGEATRLREAGIPVKPFPLDSQKALLFSRIDGATLCDSNGQCHAVGVILDGLATSAGDRARGARFNSTVRYVASRGTDVAAMVVSEDGGLTLLPHLKLAVESAKLLAVLGELEALATSDADPPDRHRQLHAIHWVERNVHVLTREQCEAVNGWIKTIDDRFYADSQVWPVRQPFSADPNFKSDRDLF